MLAGDLAAPRQQFTTMTAHMCMACDQQLRQVSAKLHIASALHGQKQILQQCDHILLMCFEASQLDLHAILPCMQYIMHMYGTWKCNSGQSYLEMLGVWSTVCSQKESGTAACCSLQHCFPVLFSLQYGQAEGVRPQATLHTSMSNESQ